MNKLDIKRRIELSEKLPPKAVRGKHAIDMLTEKYGIEFGCKEVRPYDIKDDYYVVIAYSLEKPELLFEVRVSLEENEFNDEYAVKNACDDYAFKMINRIANLNGFLFVRMNSMIRGFELPEKEIDIMTLQNKRINKDYILDIFYTKEPDEEDNLFEAVNQMFSGMQGLNGILNVYVLPAKLWEKAKLYLDSHDKMYLDFQKLIDYTAPVSFDFTDGKLDVSEKSWNERISISV